MCEPSSPEIRLPRETDCGIFGSAEPVYRGEGHADIADWN